MRILGTQRFAAIERPNIYQKKTVDKMTNREIINALCKDQESGCVKCEVLPWCRYGREARRRGLLTNGESNGDIEERADCASDAV